MDTPTDNQPDNQPDPMPLAPTHDKQGIVRAAAAFARLGDRRASLRCWQLAASGGWMTLEAFALIAEANEATQRAETENAAKQLASLEKSDHTSENSQTRAPREPRQPRQPRALRKTSPVVKVPSARELARREEQRKAAIEANKLRKEKRNIDARKARIAKREARKKVRATVTSNSTLSVQVDVPMGVFTREQYGVMQRIAHVSIMKGKPDSDTEMKRFVREQTNHLRAIEETDPVTGEATTKIERLPQEWIDALKRPYEAGAHQARRTQLGRSNTDKHASQRSKRKIRRGRVDSGQRRQLSTAKHTRQEEIKAIQQASIKRLIPDSLVTQLSSYIKETTELIYDRVFGEVPNAPSFSSNVSLVIQLADSKSQPSMTETKSVYAWERRSKTLNLPVHAITQSYAGGWHTMQARPKVTLLCENGKKSADGKIGFYGMIPLLYRNGVRLRTIPTNGRNRYAGTRDQYSAAHADVSIRLAIVDAWAWRDAKGHVHADTATGAEEMALAEALEL